MKVKGHQTWPVGSKVNSANIPRVLTRTQSMSSLFLVMTFNSEHPNKLRFREFSKILTISHCRFYHTILIRLRHLS